MNDMEYRAGGLPILAITGNQSVDDDEGASPSGRCGIMNPSPLSKPFPKSS
jgi:hypothetical protein